LWPANGSVVAFMARGRTPTWLVVVYSVQKVSVPYVQHTSLASAQENMYGVSVVLFPFRGEWGDCR
jgi:hypothetical protein